jgi:hypothetical protein
MSQIEDDLALILSYVRALPTRDELRDFGATIGRDVGALAQQLDTIEAKLNRVLDERPNGQQRPRPARVR